jgi:DNA-binding response OmpR family regulator
MKVLIVEDDPVSLKLVESILTKKGYETVTLTSGKEAIDLLDNDNTIDLIISDIMMPGIDGFQLLKYMNSHKKLQKIPVILCTARNDKEAVLKGLDLGARDYIAKPIRAELLLEKVEKLVQKIPGVVLIVDDEELLRNLLEKIITRQGHKVMTARDGREALDIIKKHKVSLVISDIKMPEIDGLELLVKIKEGYPRLPVLLMTGHTSEFTRTEALAVGADGYIEKPFHNYEILSKVQSFVYARGV